ncbi:MAG: hypothetical protein WDN08_18235 [Rhizomicrobium sp.]
MSELRELAAQGEPWRRSETPRSFLGYRRADGRWGRATISAC